MLARPLAARRARPLVRPPARLPAHSPPPGTVVVSDAALVADETVVASFERVALECGDDGEGGAWGEGRLTCTSR